MLLLCSFLLVLRIAAEPTLVAIDSPLDGTILFGQIQTLKVSLHGVQHGSSTQLSICKSVELIPPHIQLDARAEIPFPSSKENRSCVLVGVVGERNLQAQMTFDATSGTGWYGVSVSLFEDNSLVSFSQSVVHISVDNYIDDDLIDNNARIGLALPIGGGFGWGTIGYQLAQVLTLDSENDVVFLREVHGGTMTERERKMVESGIANSIGVAGGACPSQ